MKKQPVVFLGPSLPIDLAKELLDARFEPPIKRHDLAPLIEAGYDTFGIIDGEFFQNLSVSPREILQYLKKGIAFYGSSSMGALRASELYMFGMVGIGHVFQQYKQQFIQSDDEVALLFDSERFRPLSEPLVNIRYAFYEAYKHKVVTKEEFRLLVDLAKSMKYQDRTFAKIIRNCAAIPKETSQNLSVWIREHRSHWDLKGLDAIRLLKTLKQQTQ